MGLIGYFRRSIPNLSKKAKILFDLLKGHENIRKSKQPIMWEQKHQAALDTLLKDLTTPPLLAHPNFDLPFILHTDASSVGLGCALYQIQDSKLRVIGYGSRTLVGAECKYHGSKLEFLALKWAICNHFHEYLYYAKHFDVYTDYNPLTYVKTSCKLNATGQRWVNELANYHFSIHYKPGTENPVADTLSRQPLNSNQSLKAYSTLCTEDEVKSLLDGAVIQGRDEETWVALVNSISSTTSDELQNQILYNAGGSKDQILRQEDIRSAQANDPVIKKVIELKMKNKDQLSNEERKHLSPAIKDLVRHWENLDINESGLLIRTSPDKKQKQVVIPSSIRPIIYSGLHVNMGHLGADRVIELAKDRCFWPRMDEDIQHFTTKVCQCVKQKKPHISQVAYAMKPIQSAAPMELISIDFLHLDTCSGGYQYILVITDNFSRFSQAYPTRNKEAKTAAEKLYNDFILRFGIPGKILHDQGKEFENSLFKQLSKLCGIKRLRTTPYHPEGNGQCERMNKTIISMLKTLTEANKSSWKDHINKIVYAYNCTKHSTTGCSPYYLLFGRKPRLPIDLLLAPDTNATQHQSKYMDKWKTEMEQAYKIAAHKSSQRKGYDIERHKEKKPCLTTLELGDRVLVRNLSERGGTGKMIEPEIHTIISPIGENPVTYKVQQENNTKAKVRVLHRNHLLLCDNLLDNFDWKIDIPTKKPSENHKQPSSDKHHEPLTNKHEKSLAENKQNSSTKIDKSHHQIRIKRNHQKVIRSHQEFITNVKSIHLESTQTSKTNTNQP